MTIHIDHEKIEFGELGSTPETPSTGTLSLYAKDDSKFYMLNDAGTETVLGGSGSSTLAGLTDVGITSPITNSILAYNESTSEWENDNGFINHQYAIRSAGRLYGGELTEGSSPGTVNISAGIGLVKTKGTQTLADLETVPDALGNGQAGETSLVTWDAQTDFALAGVGYNLIYWDASADDFAVQLREDFYANFDFVSDFTVGRVYYDGTDVTIRICGMNEWNFNRRVQMFGEENFPVRRAFGLVLSETGTRNIAMTAGVVWAELVNRFSIDAFDSSGAGTFTYWYRNGSGGWTSVATQTQINNTSYDDGDGTLGTLTANRYGVHWVYVVHDGTVHVVYGQGDYTLAQAELTTQPSTLPGLLGAYATWIGRIIIQKSSDTFASLVVPDDEVIGFTTVPNHNDLSGLQGGTADEYYHWTSADYTNRVTTSNAVTLTGKTIDGDDNTVQDLPYSAIKSTSRSGSDVTLVTGTAGTNGNFSQWNADGDLVDSIHPAPTGTLTSSDNIQTLSGKTLLSPIIDNLLYAQHDHQDGDDGGLLNAGLVFSTGTLPATRGGTGYDGFNYGDLFVATSTSAIGKLPLGTDNQILRVDDELTHGMEWVDDEVGFSIIIGDGVNAITTTPAIKGWIEMPFAFLLQSWTLTADASGSIVVDIWKDSYANFPPTDADSITSASPPTLSTAQKNTNSTLSGWTTVFAKGDWLMFNVDSATTVKQVTLSLKGKKWA